MLGIEEVLDYCTDFINTIDDFEDVDIHTDFECYPTSNEVFIALVVSSKGVNDFMDNIYNKTKVRDISEFSWAILHEVGHCETWHKMNKRTINKCRHIKRKISRRSIDERIYYNLTDERIATEWAIDYIEKNHDLVKKFDDEVLKLIKDFYLKNNLNAGVR